MAKFFSQIQLLEFFDVFSVLLKAASCAYATSYYTKVYVQVRHEPQILTSLAHKAGAFCFMRQTAGPLFVLGLLFLAFVKTKEPAFYDLLLFVSFVVYPTSSATLIQYFDCYPVWHGVAGTQRTNYLLKDPSIKCTDEKYLSQALFYVLPMTAVFLVGFPLYYAKLVWGDRAFINPKPPTTRTVSRLRGMQNKVIPSEPHLKYALGQHFGLWGLNNTEVSVLYHHWSADGPVLTHRLVELFEYGQSYEKWSKMQSAAKEHRHTARNAAVEPAPTLRSSPLAVREKLQAHAIRAFVAAKTRSKTDRERWAMHAREGDERAQRSAFLWKAYRPKFYWFEVFDMLRKFLLTGLPLILNSMFPNSSSISLAVGLLASVFGMAAYATASPFADYQDSVLMLPAQLQVTVTMLMGMLMEVAAGNPWAELAISLTVIVSFMPIMVFGLYLMYDPDFDLVAYLSGTAVVKLLGPFLSNDEHRKDKLAAVKLAVQLVLNPNLDHKEDIRRLGGDNGALVVVLVETVSPLLEGGAPDAEDVMGMIESLLDACSGEMARRSGKVVEMLAVKVLALVGVPPTHPIVATLRGAVKQIGTTASNFRSLNDCYEALLPLLMGDVSEEGAIDVLEAFGLDPLDVARALLPFLLEKSLAASGMDVSTASTMGERARVALQSWDEGRLDEAKEAIAGCLDGDITQSNLEQLLALTGMSKDEAACAVGAHLLQHALAVALPGDKPIVKRVMVHVKAAFAPSANAIRSKLSYQDVCRLVSACVDATTRDAVVVELLQLVGEVSSSILEPMVRRALLHVGFRADSSVVAQAGEGVRKLTKDVDAVQAVTAMCAESMQHSMGDVGSALEALSKLLEALGVESETAKCEVMEIMMSRMLAMLGAADDSTVAKIAVASIAAASESSEAEVQLKFEAVRLCAASFVGGDAETILPSIFTLLHTFDVSEKVAASVMIPAMLVHVLEGLEVVHTLA